MNKANIQKVHFSYKTATLLKEVVIYSVIVALSFSYIISPVVAEEIETQTIEALSADSKRGVSGVETSVETIV